MAQKFLQYEVLERLGTGARSTIYAVKDPATRKTFALKHVHRSDEKDVRFIEQMEQEFEISKAFTHPNLRRTIDLKILKSMFRKNEAIMVMELVDGIALDARPPKGLLVIIDTFIQVAQGLRAMHQLGYVHCDMKPNNVLRNDAGQVKVIDYGQSCKIGTIKERIQGTPDYIAPEQVNRQPVTEQTDIFNFGATLYFALTGKHIPTLYTVNKTGENSFLLHAKITTPSEIDSTIPPMLSKLVMECISTTAKKRPPNMDDVLTRLELAKHMVMKQEGKVAPLNVPSAEDSAMGAAAITDAPAGEEEAEFTLEDIEKELAERLGEGGGDLDDEMLMDEDQPAPPKSAPRPPASQRPPMAQRPPVSPPRPAASAPGANPANGANGANVARRAVKPGETPNRSNSQRPV